MNDEKRIYTILVVDDEIEILKSLKRLLRAEYIVLTASSTTEGEKIFRQKRPNLVMSDNKMPEKSGIEFLETIYNIDPEPIRILFTGYTNIKNAIDAINKGHVYNYITKPWHPDELKLTIKSALEKYELERTRKNLLSKLRTSYKKILNTLTIALETRDAYTSGHSYRVAYYSGLLGRKLNLSNSDIELLQSAGLLHDIGKIGIAENVLNKHGKLERIEKREIEKHPIFGARILSPLPEFEKIANLVLCHHEHVDGSGYPRHLKGDEIPYLAKIIAITDAFDALTTDRPYRKAFSLEKSLALMFEKADIFYDKELLIKFEEVIKDVDIEKIKQETNLSGTNYEYDT